MSNPLSTLFQAARQYSCGKGQLLITPDEFPRGVHYIQSGYVKSYDIGAEGEYQVISIAGPGEIFPLYWSIDEESSHLFYETMCPTVINILPKTEFKAAFENNTELLKTLLALVLRSYRFSQERIQNLEIRNTQQRLAFRLLFIGKYFGHIQGKTIEIAVPMTYQDLAESLNLTRETVNRSMREFITDGIVNRSDHHMAIDKPEKLREIVGEVALNI
jgi:CRP-like cAMP-binding protein